MKTLTIWIDLDDAVDAEVIVECVREALAGADGVEVDAWTCAPKDNA